MHHKWTARSAPVSGVGLCLIGNDAAALDLGAVHRAYGLVGASLVGHLHKTVALGFAVGLVADNPDVHHVAITAEGLGNVTIRYAVRKVAYVDFHRR